MQEGDKTPQRTYRTSLRDIGVHLDSGGIHSVSIIEVTGGLIVCGSRPGSRTPIVLEIPDGERIELPRQSEVEKPIPHRLLPGGYATFFDALGRLLDRSCAASISIVEGTDFITVGGIQAVAQHDTETEYEPLDILLLADDIERVLIQRPVP